MMYKTIIDWHLSCSLFPQDSVTLSNILPKHANVTYYTSTFPIFPHRLIQICKLLSIAYCDYTNQIVKTKQKHLTKQMNSRQN